MEFNNGYLSIVQIWYMRVGVILHNQNSKISKPYYPVLSEKPLRVKVLNVRLRKWFSSSNLLFVAEAVAEMYNINILQKNFQTRAEP